MLNFAARSEEVGERVDVVLAKRAGVTRTLAQRALKDGEVTVSGKMVRPSYRLEGGDRIEGEVPEPVFERPEGEDIPVAIRYEDDDVLVVSKPPGIVTHPGRGHEAGTLVNALLGLGMKLSGEESIRPGIVHRLDKDTSGLLVVAKTDAAAESLIAAIKGRSVERRYLALVRGAPSASSGTIEAPVGRHPVRRRQMAVVSGGKPSVTHYRVLGRTEEVTLLEVSLETGRTHQIRVHLAHLGLPVLGDATYGGRSELSARLGIPRTFLHAHHLAFPQPTTGARIEVTDPLPEDLATPLAPLNLPLPE
ncbi:MAG: RluA family pseudouridine synthase [Actinobacteria bacterium]|nr:RluA family pseudouridine synthase [Actinomycetota bacterium]